MKVKDFKRISNSQIDFTEFMQPKSVPIRAVAPAKSLADKDPTDMAPFNILSAAPANHQLSLGVGQSDFT